MGGRSGWTWEASTPKGGALSHEDVWVWRSIAFRCHWNQDHAVCAGQGPWPGGTVTRRLSEPAWSC